MVNAMEHEGFYTSGLHAMPAQGIYAGWVAHSGSFAADQVFWNEQKSISLILAGECFLDSAAQSELMRKGHELGKAPGGWLVHQYEEQGESFFAKLNGLFSGLLIDQQKGCAFLFNDRYGIERLYWCETKEATYFASEAKALLRILPELRVMDRRALAQLLTFGCTLEWTALFKGMQIAPSASLWRIENGHCQRATYFSASEWEMQEVLSENAFQEAFTEAFQRIIPLYLKASGRVGVALTGGLDTRMIMACLPADPQELVAYTYAGTQGRTRDVRVAASVARACGVEHSLLRIGPDFFENYEKLLDRTVYLTDGCFGALGVHEVYLNAQARRCSPLRLTGVFGSEILRGVSTFKPSRLSRELLVPEIRREAENVRPGEWAQMHSVTFAAFREIPWNIFGSLAACRSQVVFRTPFLDNEIVSLAYRAPESVRRSPQTAIRFIEGCRSTVSAIPTDRGHLGRGPSWARAFRRGVAELTFKLDYFQNEGMPHRMMRWDSLFQSMNDVLPMFGQHKFLHYRRWFRQELAGWLRSVASEEDARDSAIWNRGEVKRMVEEHIGGARNRIADIGGMLTWRAIERTLLRG